VILRRESKSSAISRELIVQAAQVAAFFSKAKHSHLVPVIYTEVRHVRKPRKAPAGLVQVTKEKSMMVQPLPPPGYHGAGYKE
jgi:predicted ribosome quality control (RQC) complex YloA/Tae2 family protein